MNFPSSDALGRASPRVSCTRQSDETVNRFTKYVRTFIGGRLRSQRRSEAFRHHKGYNLKRFLPDHARLLRIFTRLSILFAWMSISAVSATTTPSQSWVNGSSQGTRSAIRCSHECCHRKARGITHQGKGTKEAARVYLQRIR